MRKFVIFRDSSAILHLFAPSDIYCYVGLLVNFKMYIYVHKPPRNNEYLEVYS